MIFGVGADILKVERIEQVYRRHGERFVERLLLPAELRAFQADARPVRFLAMRFAAKEAIVKAMGTGFAHGMWIRDAGVAPNTWGRPEIIWSERGREMCEKLGVGEGHISLSDEAGMVVAFAVLMRKT